MAIISDTHSLTPTATMIKSALRARLGRQWRVGDRLPPTKELARQLGWGQTNTHQAVRELANEGLLVSRQRRGTFVVRVPAQDIPQRSARRRSGLSDARVSLFYGGEPPVGFIRRMIDGFSDVMEPTGAQVRLQPNIVAERRDFRDEPVDALVFINPGSAPPLVFNPNQLVTVITTSSRLEVEGNDRYDVVSVDELHGGSLAGRALRASGCRKACFLGRGQPPDHRRCDQTSALRLLGFENAWGDGIDPAHVFLRMGYSPQAGGEIFRRYMQLTGERPDGVFAATDDIAVGFIGAAAAQDLLPVHDYQIVGFDGQELGQSVGGGLLTTVKVPAAEMGRRAAQLLIERFAQPDRPVHRLQLECALHRGTTTITPGQENPT